MPKSMRKYVQRTEHLTAAERALAEAMALRSAALSTNLVDSLGPPQVTDHPVGPSGSFLVLGSTMAGLICGLGAVFLIAPGQSDTRGGRRWSDYLHHPGRRRDETAAVTARETPGNPAEPEKTSE